ncbi:hypothetical protein EV360DRAFT_77275, partial [Lentinula raphanica]
PDKLSAASAANGKPQQQQPKSNVQDAASSSPPKRYFGPIGSPPKNNETTNASPETPTNKCDTHWAKHELVYVHGKSTSGKEELLLNLVRLHFEVIIEDDLDDLVDFLPSSRGT